MSVFRTACVAVSGLLVVAAPALAGPTYTFITSEGAQPSNVGTITLTQVNSTTVDVFVDLTDTTSPLPRYGFVNSGGPHTPFVFTLAGSESGLSAIFSQPSGGTYTFGVFNLSTGDESADPFGSFGVAIDSSAGNGTSNAYFGDLEFTLTRLGGLSTDDFITNAAIDPGSNAYFAADLTNGSSNTGSQAWEIRTTDIGGRAVDPVPEPASSLALLGLGLGSLGFLRRKLT